MRALIKRREVPNPMGPNRRSDIPKVTLYKAGIISFNILVADTFGGKDCLLMIEHDEDNSTLKFTAVGDGKKLPKGVEPEDCFPVQIRAGHKIKRPLGMMRVVTLLRYIKFQRPPRTLRLEILQFDQKGKSVTIRLPKQEAA